jgi:hypothetical protein
MPDGERRERPLRRDASATACGSKAAASPHALPVAGSAHPSMGLAAPPATIGRPDGRRRTDREARCGGTKTERDRSGETPPLRPAAARKRLRRMTCRWLARPIRAWASLRHRQRSVALAGERQRRTDREARCGGTKGRDRSGETPPLRPAPPHGSKAAATHAAGVPKAEPVEEVGTGGTPDATSLSRKGKGAPTANPPHARCGGTKTRRTFGVQGPGGELAK